MSTPESLTKLLASKLHDAYIRMSVRNLEYECLWPLRFPREMFIVRCGETAGVVARQRGS